MYIAVSLANILALQSGKSSTFGVELLYVQTFDFRRGTKPGLGSRVRGTWGMNPSFHNVDFMQILSIHYVSCMMESSHKDICL